ncbi:MAG: hypothetical protein RLZZ283_363 [Candidatus Parcubacteria bacterium]|jgi:cytoskeletal protein CcmA (bactofilin family)
MKNIFTYAAVVVVLVAPIITFAAEFRAGEQPSVLADDRIISDIYMAGGSVTSSGSIPGDLVAGGGTVVISGAVGADIIAGGGTVTILSNVADDVRVTGGTIVLQGSVGGDVLAAGGQIQLGGPSIGGDVALAGGTVRIDSPVTGSVRIGGGTVYINAPITGDIQITADQVTLGPKAVINGKLDYTASKELIVEQGATIIGKATFTQRVESTASVGVIAAIVSVWVIGGFLSLLTCSLLIGLLLRRYSTTVIARATEHPWTEIGKGLIVFVATPALVVLICSTVVGIPLGILGMLAFLTLLLIAWITTPIILGSVVHGYFTKREYGVTWKTILIGVALYSAIGLVPFVGWIVHMLLMLLSLGVVVSLKWEMLRQWR